MLGQDYYLLGGLFLLLSTIKGVNEMKIIICGVGGAVIGFITFALGFGWVKTIDGILTVNPVGAIINIVCVVVWVILVNIIYGMVEK